MSKTESKTVSEKVSNPALDRNNILFALAGVVVGFVLAYFLYEAVGENQPPRRVAQEQTGVAAPAGAPAGAPSGGGAPAQGAAQGGGVPADGGFGSGPVNAPVMQQRLDTMRAAMDDNPDNPQGWLEVANMAYDLRRWDVASEAYERYLELEPDNPDIMSDLAVSLHGAGRSDEALAKFDEAQEIADGHWQSLFNEVVVLLDLGRLDAAEERMPELRRLRPADETVRRLGAEIERRQNL